MMRIQYRYTRERNIFPTKLEAPPPKSPCPSDSSVSSRDGLGGGGARLGGGGDCGLARSKNRELLDDPIHDRCDKSEKNWKAKKEKEKTAEFGGEIVTIRKFV